MIKQNLAVTNFNHDIAKEIDVEHAILLHNIVFWCGHNEANKKNFKKGKYWTYNTAQAFCLQFPYWKADKIDRMIKKLKEKGYIEIDFLSEDKRDRTRWFAVTEKTECIYGKYGIAFRKNTESHSAESRNVYTDINITDINTNKDILSFCEQAVRYLNEKTGSEFRASTKSTKSKIKTLLDNSFTIEDIKLVIDLKTASWLNDSKMSEYLRPETLFGGKFEAYLQEAKRSLPKSKPSLPEQQW